MPVGSVLAVLASDPGSVRVTPPWTRKARHEFLGAFPEQGCTRLVMRRDGEKPIRALPAGRWSATAWPAYTTVVDRQEQRGEVSMTYVITQPCLGVKDGS